MHHYYMLRDKNVWLLLFVAAAAAAAAVIVFATYANAFSWHHSATRTHTQSMENAHTKH